ncbi:MAG: MATE family efflux transporter [Clostridia bacterium]|nr:MATE family efflux transporter [Clostridia bacterium]
MQQSALLTAPVRPLILKIALPSLLAMTASALCTLLDALLLSRFGAQHAAAAAVSFPLLAWIQTLGFTLGMGAGSFVSRCLGSGEHDRARTAASTAFFSALVLSCLLCAAGFFLAAPLVSLLGASAEALSPAAAYARYVLASGPMLCMSLVLSSLLRAQGQTLPNMIAFVFGAVVGVALLLSLIPRLGIHGAGVSMLAREGVTLALLAFSVLRSQSVIRPSPRAVSLRLRVFRDIMRSGAPTLLRQGLMSVSSAMLTRAASAYGEAALAGIGLSVRALSLISAAVIGFGQGFQPVCGAAYGAGQMERVLSAYRFCMRAVVTALAVTGAALFFFTRPLLGLFSPDAQALEIANSALRAQSVVLFAQGAVIMMNMLTQAAGMTLRASIVATSRQGFVLIPLLMLLPRFFGLTGLILSQSVSDLISLALCLLLMRGAIRDCACARGGCSDARRASR